MVLCWRWRRAYSGAWKESGAVPRPERQCPGRGRRVPPRQATRGRPCQGAQGCGGGGVESHHSGRWAWRRAQRPVLMMDEASGPKIFRCSLTGNVRARQVLSFESLPPESPTSAATWGPGADRVAQALHQRLWPETDVRSTRGRLSDTGPPAAPMMLLCRVNFPKIKHLQSPHGAPDYRGQTSARRRQAWPPPTQGLCAGADH